MGYQKGLPQDLVISTYQSSDGFLWLSGYAGLTRFDGVNFVNFNTNNLPLLRTNNVFNMVEDADKTLWIGTSNSGLLSYKNGKFEQFLTNDALFILAHRQNQLTMIANNKWAFSRFDVKSKKYELLDSANMLKAMQTGKVFFNHSRDKAARQWITILGRVYSIEKNSIKQLGEKEGISPNTSYDNPFVDSKNRVWIPSVKNGKKHCFG